MAVSKRLRYEILRRDNHTCRYCGRRSPEVKLTVDHVVPETLGGSDDPSNLVAACEDCNGGKSATPPDAAVVAQVADDAARWAAAIAAAAADLLARRDAKAQQFGAFEERWKRVCQFVQLPSDWVETVERFLALGLPLDVLLDDIEKAYYTKTVARKEVFRYLCGIAWSQVRDLQAAARAALGVTTDEGEPCEHGGVWEDCPTCVIREGRHQIASDVRSAFWNALPDLLGQGDRWTGDRVAYDDEDVLEAKAAVALAIDEVVRYRAMVAAAWRRLSPADEQWCKDALPDEKEGEPRARVLEHMLRAMLSLTAEELDGTV